MNPVATFIQKIIETYGSGHAREHSYRPALKGLFELTTGLTVINEPKRSEHGAPDFVFLKGKTVIAYAEAKNINVSLDEIEKSEQMNRYYGYSNIILTNGLDFRFYRNGIKYSDSIIIGKLHHDRVESFEDSFQLLADTIGDFIKESKEPIKSGTVLSKVMAGKARRIRDNVKKFLEDEKNPKNENLLGVYEVIKRLLLADLDHVKFADMYAQTIVYGLFVARYYDKTPDNFTRQEARDLVPASNPFLRHFFDHIAGSSFDPRIEYIVNELCEEFNHADVQAIVHDYYKIDKDSSRDPIIHFYEDFLQEYDSAERKKMGVFYTPLPVVRFIVRAVDDILKKEFSLPQGLANASKIDILKEIQGKRHKQSVHKVQVLDPATGTGTFLNEAILHIKKSFEGQEGRWSSYVNADLLPRIHGFELMMASYTIAHLKLSSTLIESGAKIEDTRLGVYLTNSLEKGEIEEKTLFDIGLGKAITEESNQANKVKNELPIMVVIGNPPYSGISQNKGYTENEAYKVEPGGLQRLQEKKNWLDDDYVKFIRLAESLIEKNDEGVVGMITSHGYIENPTFRGMRWHLRKTFDAIYILDLHGNSTKKEVSPDGKKDENVFNIKTGVSIMLGVKKAAKGKNGKLAEVYKADLFGAREDKFEKLNASNLANISWVKLPDQNDVWHLEGEGKDEYQKGFSVAKLFNKTSSGIVTMGDGFIIDQDKDILSKRIDDFIQNDISETELKNKYDLGKNYAKWIIENKGKIENDFTKIVPLAYRPFDTRYTYFDNNLVWRTRSDIMDNFFKKENLGFCCVKLGRDADSHNYFVTKYITDKGITSSLDNANIFPLYLYAEDGSRVPNLEREIVNNIENIAGKASPENILDYIYAILHSKNYREKYKEFLKIDFPRVPYPKDAQSFKALVALGRELRELHLLESPKLKNFITIFSEIGNDTVETKYPKYKDDKVFINEIQYFGGVPEIAWNFYIGGYQPMQKWLKDRQGRVLSSEDLNHYQKIIIALVETEKIMREVDKII
jgi:predicted helicase